MRRVDLLMTLKRHSRFLLVGLAMGLLVAAIVSWAAVRTYTSSTQFFIGTSGSTATSDAYEGNLFAQQRVTSYAQVITSPELTQRVVDELALPLTAQQVAGKITATPLPETVVLDVTVTDTSPERAQAIAASLGRQFTLRVTELETPPGATASTVRVDVIRTASFDPHPVSPDVIGNLWRGAAIGLVLGFGLALLRARLDRSVRDVDDAEEATGAPVLGRLFESRELANGSAGDGLGVQSPTAESYRALRVNLRSLGSEGRPKVVVVAGSLVGAGATTVAVNLAISLAAAGRQVTLIEADLRRPRVRRYLDLPDAPGLTEVLTGSTTLASAVQPWGDGRLSVIGAGSLPADPEATLDSPRMSALLGTLREQQDIVIVDAPPILPVVDAAILSAEADACLLVARYGRTKREHLAEAAATVARVRVPSLGVVINRVPRRTEQVTAGSRTYLADGHRKHPLLAFRTPSPGPGPAATDASAAGSPRNE